MNLRYFSGCSGIEAASLAWTPLGWVPVAFCEIDPFPSAVLAYHYPDVPNLGDMTRIDGTQFTGLVDVLVAGTPCQSYSVAGLRLGLSDEPWQRWPHAFPPDNDFAEAGAPPYAAGMRTPARISRRLHGN